MTGLELTERLIDDLQKSIRAKSIARGHEQLRADMMAYARDFRMKSNFSIEENWISLTCDITLPYDLGDLSQFINQNEQLVSYKSGDKVELQSFLNQVEANKDKIVATFQKLSDSPNLIAVFGQQKQTLFSYLQQKLDDLHNEAVSVDNCYKRIIESK
jgi:hypothetical protein